MSIYKRKRYYYYAFMHKGRRYHGSTKCATERKAKTFEKNIVDKLRQQGSAKALVENFQETLTGGSRIPLAEVWESFTLKSRKKSLFIKNDDNDPSVTPKLTKGGEFKLSAWRDFLAYLTAQHQDAETMNDVTRQIADGYIQYLRTNGKFNKKVSFKPKGHRKIRKYELKEAVPSVRTCNAYHIMLTEIFDKLKDDSGLLENPFRSIAKLDKKNKTKSREPFTTKELDLIAEKADPFIFAIFMIGANTGFRAGDICTLKWSEIDLDGGWIKRETRKTGTMIRLPIREPLRGFLENLPHDGEYVLPEHADMYLKNRTGVSWRVANFLNKIEIATRCEVKGRSRAVSVKDIHSLRYNFISNAGNNGIPLPMVQSIVGHMTPEMTAHYTRHAEDEQMQLKMGNLKPIFDRPKELTAGNDDRAALLAELATLSEKADIAALRRMIDAGKKCTTS